MNRTALPGPGLWLRRRVRTVWLCLTVVGAPVMLLVACGGDDSEPPALADEARENPSAAIVVPPDQPIVVGISAPITGPDGAGGAADGDGAIAGINLWKAQNGETIGGHEISVRVEDDGCTEPDITVQAAERFLRTEGLVGVLGPDCSAGAAEAIPIYAQAGVVAISGAATQTDIISIPDDGFFFRTVYDNSLQGRLIGIFLQLEIQAQEVYLIDDGESYGLDLADAAEEVLTGSGVTVTRISTQRGAVDFTELVEEVAAAQPDFVGFAGFNPEVALFYSQLRDADYNGPFGAGDAAASVETFVVPVGVAAAEGVYFSGCPLPLSEELRAEFESISDQPLDTTGFVAHYADAARVLLDAVAAVAVEDENGSLIIDPVELRDAVAATNFDDGASGHIRFDDEGGRHTDAEPTDLAGQARDLGWTACQVRDGALTVSQ